MESVEMIKSILTVYGLKVVAAIATFIIGRWVARIVRKVVGRMMVRAEVDETLIKFANNLLYMALMAFVIVASLNQLGIQTASFIAILGAAGLAVGLALQGSLSNFASGVLLILFRPFKSGDFIDGAGVSGVVESIQIFTTRLRTGDNKSIIIPNSNLTGDNIINFSAKETRRLDMVIGVGYGDDLNQVKKVLADILSADARILKDPAPVIGVSELADSSVNLVVRPWAKSGDYWPLWFDLHQTIKERFDAEGFSIPYPQQDLHLFKEQA